MTDNEIIKDLNRSILNAKMVGRRVCSLDVYKLKSILDLINRQKEKIKKFDERLVIQQGLIDYQKAEIDRLKKEVEDLRIRVATNTRTQGGNGQNQQIDILKRLSSLEKQVFGSTTKQ